MSYLVAHPLRGLACLIAVACGAHAEEATDATSTADQSKVTVGATLMSDYIYRGISYSGHQPSVAAYVDAQQGWLYGYTNFNSVKFSTSPAVEVTVAAGIRPTLGPFEFDIGAAYYYYPGELGPDLSNYWEAHATLSHKVTDKLSWGPTIAYAPDVWQSGAWGVYAAGTLAYELPSEFLPTGLGWSLSLDFGRWMFGPTSAGGRRNRGRGRACAAELQQLARRTDIQLPGLQARPQLHRHVPLEGELLRADGRPRRRSGRGGQSRQQSHGIALAPVRRDLFGNARFRIQSSDARPLSGHTSAAGTGPAASQLSSSEASAP
jgi:uncharacterized protein (TIGR02001 family)